MNIQAIWTDELTKQLPEQGQEKIIEFMELLDLLNDNMLAINLDLKISLDGFIPEKSRSWQM